MAHSVTEWLAETVVRHTPGRGPGFGRAFVREAVAQKKFDRRQLHLTELAKTLFGPTFESRLQTVSSRGQWVGEAEEAVDLTAWRDIVGAVATEAIEAGYQQVVSPVEQLVADWDSADDPNNPLLVPYPGAATDTSRDVAPGTEYPKTGFSHYSIKTPVPVKHGLIAQLTLELVLANRRQQFLDALAEVGRVVGLEMVRRKLRLVLGITQNYTVVTPAGGETTTATYVTTAGRANLVVDLNLADGPKEIDRLQQKFVGMTHPLTGEPIDVQPTAMFTVPANKYTLANAANVQEIRTTVSSVELITGNPVTFSGPIITDVRAPGLLTTEAGVEVGALSAAEAATFVVLGDFQRAFRWRKVRDLETFEAGPGDMNESAGTTWPPAFYQDVVYACKARWWGCGFVYDPYVVLAAYNQD